MKTPVLPLCALLAAALTACANHNATPDTPSVGAQRPATTASSSPPSTAIPPTDQARDASSQSAPVTDPSVAASAWLTTVLSSDTRTDTSPTAAQHRATVWAVGALAQPDPEPINGPGADWIALSKVNGRYQVRLQPAAEDQPADTQSDAWRMYVATQTPVAANGSAAGAPIIGIYRIHLTFTERGWRVQEYQLS